MRREGIQTDHQFEGSLYCDCASCNELCHFHYGLADVCLLERHMHVDIEQCPSCLPWDIPSSDRALYEPICAKPPEDRSPLETLAKRYIDLCAQSVGERDVNIQRAQKSETAAQFGLAIIRGLLTDSQLDFRGEIDCEITSFLEKGESVREAVVRIFPSL